MRTYRWFAVVYNMDSGEHRFKLITDIKAESLNNAEYSVTHKQGLRDMLLQLRLDLPSNHFILGTTLLIDVI